MAKEIYGTQTFDNVKEAESFENDLELLKREGEIEIYKTYAKIWQGKKYYVANYKLK